MKITTGNLEVFESGIAKTGFQKTIKFDFDAIWIEVVFHKNKDELSFEFKPSDCGKGLYLHLYNYGGPFGSGFIEPVKLGSLEDREFWFTFEARQVSPEHEAWSMEYIFYKGEPVNE
ncbi:DUF6864 domain-containing function [Aliivibrio fischeri]|uniref:DUF6864 domain-containing function n=1 Tax=Aliivibrio fischeri TaxID=668 RepID=UPI0007C5947E|nr:hypothetical protein [Aliivibrio fischeri]